MVLRRGLPGTGLELSPGVLQERGQEEEGQEQGEVKEAGAGAREAGSGGGGERKTEAT